MRKDVYLFDSTALVRFAGALYGCFLVENFDSKYLIPGEGNVFVIDVESLEEIAKMEAEGKNGIYKGYTTFITNNFKVISHDKTVQALRTENAIKKYHDGFVIMFEHELFAGTFGALFHLYTVENIDPILVTYEPEVERVANELGFTTYKG